MYIIFTLETNKRQIESAHYDLEALLLRHKGYDVIFGEFIEGESKQKAIVIKTNTGIRTEENRYFNRLKQLYHQDGVLYITHGRQDVYFINNYKMERIGALVELGPNEKSVSKIVIDEKIYTFI